MGKPISTPGPLRCPSMLAPLAWMEPNHSLSLSHPAGSIRKWEAIGPRMEPFLQASVFCKSY